MNAPFTAAAIEDDQAIRTALYTARELALNNIATAPAGSWTRDLNVMMADVAHQIAHSDGARTTHLEQARALCRRLMAVQKMAGVLEGIYEPEASA